MTVYNLYLLSYPDLPQDRNELADDVDERSLLGHDHSRQIKDLDPVRQVSDADPLIVCTSHHDDLVSLLL